MAYDMKDQSAAVRRLQEYLRRIAWEESGLPLILTDGVYDERTAGAVKNFQSAHGLPADGKVDLECWNKIFDEYQRIGAATPSGIDPFLLYGVEGDIGEGTEGDSVVMLKLLLRALGPYYDEFAGLGCDGSYDAETEAAVRSFQKKNGVAATGRVDRLTWNALCAESRNATGHYEG